VNAPPRLLRLSLLLAALPLWLGLDLLQSRDKAVEEGNAQMKAGKPEQALGSYDDAVKRLPQDPSAHFNRGAALYGLSRWEEAAQSFLQATEAKPPALKSSAFYNLGNAFFQAKKFGEAVEAFKKSLAYNPGDQRAKWNLELALRSKKDEDQKNKDKKGQKDKNDEENQKGEEKKADEKDEQAKNEPEKPGDSKDKNDQKDKDGQDEKKDQQADQKDKNQPPEQQQAKQDPKQKPEDKGQGKPDQQDKQDKQDQKQASNQPQQGPAGNKGKQPPPDMQEVDAILDNLEKSPKALEQELARVRARHRRPPAKDW
jgi:Ca-activated chloride channel family protein